MLKSFYPKVIYLQYQFPSSLYSTVCTKTPLLIHSCHGTKLCGKDELIFEFSHTECSDQGPSFIAHITSCAFGINLFHRNFYQTAMCGFSVWKRTESNGERNMSIFLFFLVWSKKMVWQREFAENEWNEWYCDNEGRWEWEWRKWMMEVEGWGVEGESWKVSQGGGQREGGIPVEEPHCDAHSTRFTPAALPLAHSSVTLWRALACSSCTLKAPLHPPGPLEPWC